MLVAGYEDARLHSFARRSDFGERRSLLLPRLRGALDLIPYALRTQNLMRQAGETRPGTGLLLGDGMLASHVTCLTEL